MKRFEDGQISRRERQVMDILFRKGKATAGEVLDSPRSIRNALLAMSVLISETIALSETRRPLYFASAATELTS